MSIIGDNIRVLREKLNISQIKLAKETKLSPAAISQYESNARKPTLEALKVLSKYFNVSIETLIGENEIEKNISDNIMFIKINSLSEKDKESIKNFIDFLAHKNFEVIK
jgi:transcriptional regulator with XRE-family HTH domain